VLVLFPRPVQPGDSLRLIAPSGPFDRTLFFRALGWLSRRYRVKWQRGLLERQGYLAGNDQRRLEELNQALQDPSASAIIAVRGGYGATRICHEADFASLVRYPKWCVGFSDFTALHLEAARVGVSSIHAPNLMALGRSDAAVRAGWLQAVEQPLRRQCFGGLQVLCTGTAAGTLLGGNLSLLFAYAASGRLCLPPGCLLFFEEINEAPYRIDRMLTSLLVGGHLRGVTGVCVGDLTDGQHEQVQCQALEVVRERLQPLGIPVLAGLPVGHAAVNQVLPLGVPAALCSDPPRLVVNSLGGDVSQSGLAASEVSSPNS
jgi:muramoyltetrapeptide carboxypeptidase